MTYDYLIVGSGLFRSTFAYEAVKRNKKIKAIEKRNHIAGNIYTGLSKESMYINMGHTFFKQITDQYGIM